MSGVEIFESVTPTPQDQLIIRLSHVHAVIDDAITDVRELAAEARILTHHSASGDLPEDCQYEYMLGSLAMLALELEDALHELPEPRLAR